MAIIRLCRTFPRVDYPGIGLHCYNFTKHIQEPTFIFTKHMDSPVLDVPSNASLVEVDYSDISFRKEKEPIWRLLLIVLSKIWGEIYFSLKVASYIRRNKIDISIVHLHSINYLMTAVLIKLLFKAPMVMNFGGTDLVRVKKSRLLQMFARFTDGALFVAEAMRPDLERLFPNKILTFMGNGVDLKKFKPANNQRQKQFLAIGNLRWQKGYSYLLEALKLVVDRSPDVKLVVAGEGPDREALEEQIEQLGLQEHVNLMGMCSREQLVDLLGHSHGFVMASVSEGFPKSLIEAIACQTPVVVTDVGECGRIAPNVGLVVPAKNAEALASAMSKLLEDTKLYEKYAAACLVEREEYGWKKMTDRVAGAYKEIRNGC